MRGPFLPRARAVLVLLEAEDQDAQAGKMRSSSSEGVGRGHDGNASASEAGREWTKSSRNTGPRNLADRRKRVANEHHRRVEIAPFDPSPDLSRFLVWYANEIEDPSRIPAALRPRPSTHKTVEDSGAGATPGKGEAASTSPAALTPGRKYWRGCCSRGGGGVFFFFFFLFFWGGGGVWGGGLWGGGGGGGGGGGVPFSSWGVFFFFLGGVDYQRGDDVQAASIMVANCHEKIWRA